MSWLAILWPPLAPLLAVDTNPDTPTSILAAVIFLGGLMLSALVYDRSQIQKRHDTERAEWKRDLAELQKKVDELQASSVNRERQLGTEFFPLVEQLKDVLQSFNRGLVQQTAAPPVPPVQSSPGIDADLARRLSAFIDAMEGKR